MESQPGTVSGQKKNDLSHSRWTAEEENRIISRRVNLKGSWEGILPGLICRQFSSRLLTKECCEYLQTSAKQASSWRICGPGPSHYTEHATPPPVHSGFGHFLLLPGLFLLWDGREHEPLRRDGKASAPFQQTMWETLFKQNPVAWEGATFPWNRFSQLKGAQAHSGTWAMVIFLWVLAQQQLDRRLRLPSHPSYWEQALQSLAGALRRAACWAGVYCAVTTRAPAMAERRVRVGASTWRELSGTGTACPRSLGPHTHALCTAADTFLTGTLVKNTGGWGGARDLWAGAPPCRALSLLCAEPLAYHPSAPAYLGGGGGREQPDSRFSRRHGHDSDPGCGAS